MLAIMLTLGSAFVTGVAASTGLAFGHFSTKIENAEAPGQAVLQR
jgi:hypothetical protein